MKGQSDMNIREKLCNGCVYWKKFRQIIGLALVLLVDLVFTGSLVNGAERVQPVEENSSPGQLIVMKGSSVWLHWNYTYLGDGGHGSVTSTYREQIIGFNSTSNSSIQVLAKRIGQNGTLRLESPIPAPFNGRVEVISSNSTLVIHRLQYNDSSYRFLSTVSVNIQRNGTTTANVIYMKPLVSIVINGIPEVIKQLPNTIEVIAGSKFMLTLDMDGSPKPSVQIRWSHLPISSRKTLPIFPLYPFVYTSTYVLSNTDASYCGRILEITVKNSIGSSSVISTTVHVLLNDKMSYNKWEDKDSALVGGMALLVIIIVVLLRVTFNLREKLKSEKFKREPRPKSQPDVMHYMDLQTRSNENDSEYTKLEAEYDDIKPKEYLIVQ